MESAFGVEHGGEEIAKFGLPTGLIKPITSLGSKIGGATRSMGGKTMTSGIKQIKTSPNMGKVGQAKLGAGGALRRAGSTMAAHPTTTGGIGAGVAAGGVAAGVSTLGNNQRKR